MAQDRLSLEALIGEVETRSRPKAFLLGQIEHPAGTDPELERLSVAISLAQEIGAVADDLVDHFVTAARDAGSSWAQIGGVLGVTKQAAQQRFVDVVADPSTDAPRGKRRLWRRGRPFFQRFTGRARAVVTAAQGEAKELHHDYIGTEHILLGLLGEGVAGETLGALGVTSDRVRRRILDIVGPGEGAPAGHIPFTPRSKKVLELSLRESLQLKHNYIGTEHILLGLLKEGDGLAARVLTELGAPPERIRKELLGRLG